MFLSLSKTVQCSVLAPVKSWMKYVECWIYCLSWASVDGDVMNTGLSYKIDFLIILYNPNKLGAAINFAGGDHSNEIKYSN